MGHISDTHASDIGRVQSGPPHATKQGVTSRRCKNRYHYCSNLLVVKIARRVSYKLRYCVYSEIYFAFLPHGNRLSSDKKLTYCIV